jgi:hypothetical protein
MTSSSVENQISEKNVPAEHVRRVHAFVDRLVACGVPRQVIETRYYLINSEILTNQDEFKVWHEACREYDHNRPDFANDNEAFFKYLEGTPPTPEYKYQTATIPKARVRFRMPTSLAKLWSEPWSFDRYRGERYYTYYYISTNHHWVISDNTNYYPPRVSKTHGPYFQCEKRQTEMDINHHTATNSLVLNRPQKCIAKYYLLAEIPHEHIWKDEGYNRWERTWTEDGVKYYRSWSDGTEEPVDIKYPDVGDEYEDEFAEEDPDND